MKRLAAVVLGAVLLTSCSSPQPTAKQQLQNDTADLVDAVNGKDTTAVAAAASALRQDINNLIADGTYSKTQGQRLKRLLDQVQLNSGDLVASPTPSATVPPTPSATPTVSPTPSPTPSAAATESPTPPPMPTATEAPTSPPAVIPTTLGVGADESASPTTHP